jgi:hypothetical protein
MRYGFTSGDPYNAYSKKFIGRSAKRGNDVCASSGIPHYHLIATASKLRG